MNIDHIVRTAATVESGYSGDLTAVKRRGRAYRRNRAIATAGAAVLVLGVGATAYAGIAAPPQEIAASATPRIQQPQRMKLTEPGPAQDLINGRMVSLEDQTGVPGEMLPDGKIVRFTLDYKTLGSVVAHMPLANGRAVVITLVKQVVPGEPTRYQPTLRLLDSAGKPLITRNISRKGESVKLLNATDTAAYLVRKDGVVRHDLATGTETMLITTEQLGADMSQQEPYQRLSVEGGRLAYITGDWEVEPWAIRIFDIERKKLIKTINLDTFLAGPVRLSPDGLHVAVAYQQDNSAAMKEHFVIFEVESGRPRLDEVTGTYVDLALFGHEHVRGLVWRSNTTMQVALAKLPPSPKGTYNADKITISRTFTIR